MKGNFHVRFGIGGGGGDSTADHNESGPGARVCEPDWVRTIRDRCVAAGVAFYHKQWGGRTAKGGGRELDGRTWDEYPLSLQASTV